MISGLIAALVLLFLFEGTGSLVLEILHIDKKGYAAPIGAAVLFAAFELFWVYALAVQGPMLYIKISGIVLLAFSALIALQSCRRVFEAWRRKDSLYVIAVICLFVFLRLKCGGAFAAMDETERLLIAQSAKGISSMPSVLQGYGLFRGFLYWLLGNNADAVIMCLSVAAAAAASMLSLNMVNYFSLKNPWFRFTLISCMLFYTEFYSWRIAAAYSGGNWRIMFTALMLFTAYRWMKENNEQIKYLFLFIIGAGLFAHHGFLTVSVEFLYCLSVCLYRIQKIRSLFDMTSFMIPSVLYFGAVLMGWNVWAGILLILLYAAFILIRYRRRVYTSIIDAEYFFIDHNRVIFLAVIPACFLIGSMILRFVLPERSLEIRYYFNYLVSAPVANFIFLSRNFIDYVLGVFRLGGLIVFLMKAGRFREDRMMRGVLICMTVFFINPLCMGLLAGIMGSELYACGFEVLFNPFTDILLFVWIYQMCEWTVIGQWVLELCLIGSAVFGHIASFAGSQQGLYPGLVHPAENITEVHP